MRAKTHILESATRKMFIHPVTTFSSTIDEANLFFNVQPSRGNHQNPRSPLRLHFAFQFRKHSSGLEHLKTTRSSESDKQPAIITMAQPSRRDYMSSLVHDDCDICYQPMTEPTRLSCRHYFCLECIRSWLDGNNTCPSCRAQLFEEPGEPNDGPPAEGAPARLTIVSETNNTTRVEIRAERTGPETMEEYLNRMDGIRATIRRIPRTNRLQTVTLDSTAMSIIPASLQSEQHARLNCTEDLGDCDVQYTFATTEGDGVLWTFNHMSYISHSRSRATTPIEAIQMGVYAANREEWTGMVSGYLLSVDAQKLDKLVEFLRRADIGRLPHARRLVVSVRY